MVFFFNDTATTEIYTLSLHDALPIFAVVSVPSGFSVADWPELRLPMMSMSLNRRLLASSVAAPAGARLDCTNALPFTSPFFRTLPTARVILAQAKEQLLAMRCPPALI